jgi:hypothetical protein
MKIIVLWNIFSVILIIFGFSMIGYVQERRACGKEAKAETPCFPMNYIGGTRVFDIGFACDVTSCPQAGYSAGIRAMFRFLAGYG